MSDIVADPTVDLDDEGDNSPPAYEENGRAIPREPNGNFKTIPAEPRFWSRVRVGEGCWEWIGGRSNAGYGQFSIEGKNVKAHRFAYELLVGPIPKGLQIDHLCRVRHCVNPEHLEPVTQAENILRGVGAGARNRSKTHAPCGHQYSGFRHGCRRCLLCYKEQRRLAQQRRSKRARVTT